ncbi:hypothetical protein [Luteimonas panaciterrae]|uniref:hypothetical protein n=1 Tax=Luteimonas panaciterrae TaxID=363885 RepID=UPI001CF98E8A|nr:hypothetical protein [Luteimonas panaciterrae]
MSKQPTVTIRGEALPNNVTTKNGAVKTVYRQAATLDAEQVRMNFDLEVDGPNVAYRVGAVYDWDVFADLVAGQYQRVELSRRMTLRPQDKQAAKAA